MKKKSLGTVIGLAFLFAAFVAAIAEGVKAVMGLNDPFWMAVAAIVWGSFALTIWLVSCIVWEE